MLTGSTERTLSIFRLRTGGLNADP